MVMARDAVFRSWQNDRAKHYRRIDDYARARRHVCKPWCMATSVTPVAPGLGSLAIRIGTKEFYGEFLMNAQGEDVVAGIRTPSPNSKRSCRMFYGNFTKSRRGWRTITVT